jgi:hypothetical protein
VGSIKAVGYLLSGTIEAFPENFKLDNERFEETLNNFFDAVMGHVIPSLDQELASALIETIDVLFESILAKVQDEGLNVDCLKERSSELFMILLGCQGVFSQL